MVVKTRIILYLSITVIVVRSKVQNTNVYLDIIRAIYLINKDKIKKKKTQKKCVTKTKATEI